YYVFVKLPETDEDYTFITDVSYLANGIWWEEDPSELTKEIAYNPETLKDDIIEMLNNLNVDDKEKHFVSNAIKCIQRIADHITTEDDYNKAILETVKAINFLRKITSIDTKDIRIKLDWLLMDNEQ
ncbi:hypothetical protein J7L48_09985, partial [bacterium]|nr:hypothetical protein [bacterium]